jgi:hypothetical protein
MITLQQIRDALVAQEYDQLLHLWKAATNTEIENCDQRKKSTLLVGILEAAIFEGTTSVEDKRLQAMLSAIECGNHPYDDPVAMKTINALTREYYDEPKKAIPGST